MLKASVRLPRISLEEIGILPGTVLTLSRDEDVHATVVPGNRVEYEGQGMSLSSSALAALHKLGYKSPTASGSTFWMYDGKTLEEIREAVEASEGSEPEV